MPANEPYEVIEVPVRKVEVKVTLDDILKALEQHAGSLATTQQDQPQAATQLHQLNEFASQFMSRFGVGSQTKPEP